MSDNNVQIAYFGSTDSRFAQLADLVSGFDEPIQLLHIKTKPKLVDILEKNTCQLIIGCSKDKGFDVFGISKLNEASTQKTPLIGVFESDSISIADAMEKGLNDYINWDDTKHLQLVIQRELKYVKVLSETKTDVVNKDFTGLLSRTQFLDDAEKTIPDRMQNSEFSAILYLQLDNFSWINESIGILSGDSYLKNTASIIASLLEKSDIAARYQGGSFVLLVNSMSIKKLGAKADMLRESIGEAISYIDGSTISSTCSIGVRILTEKSEELQEVISDAFEASDIAKGNGGDSVHLFKSHEEVSELHNTNHAWDVRIREAFDKDLFILFFQPIVSLRGDVKPRYEVLLRMIDEEQNIIAPGTFLPFAERAGLMADIDRRVILHSLEKLIEEKEKGIDTEIFIKLSGKSLDDKTMASWICNTIKDMNVDTTNIVFEITESLALTHLSQTRKMIDSLKDLGCKIAIDHFGTRLKSFKLLKLIAVDYLKVDGSLVSQLQTNKAHQTIVQKICKTAKADNIQIMAESVQDVNNLPIIWQYGFQFVQGYFLQIPDEQMEYDFSNLLF